MDSVADVILEIEATRFFLMNLSTTDIIIGSVLTLLALAALLAVSIFMVIANRSSRVLGAFATVAALAGMIAQWVCVIACNSIHKKIDGIFDSLIFFFEYIMSYNSIPFNPGTLLLQLFTPKMILCMATVILLPVVFYVGMILMAVYSGRQLSSPKKGFAVVAMILSIAYAALQFLGFLSPAFVIWPKPVLQLVWTVIYNGLLILPALLLAVQGIFVMVDNKKKKAQPSAENAEE